MTRDSTKKRLSSSVEDERRNAIPRYHLIWADVIETKNASCDASYHPAPLIRYAPLPALPGIQLIPAAQITVASPVCPTH